MKEKRMKEAADEMQMENVRSRRSNEEKKKYYVMQLSSMLRAMKEQGLQSGLSDIILARRNRLELIRRR
jgi:hypothetical protein